MEEIINRTRSREEINNMSPLVWAYIGDAVYELFIRNNLINNTLLKPHMLHIESIKYVKAEAQSKILKSIQPKLTVEEQEIVRRGRNAQNHHLPKNASPEDYMYSTAFEGLIGYLYLTKQDKRLKEILEMIEVSKKY